MHGLAARVSDRAAAAGLTLDPALLDGLLAYYDLLHRWNAKINLTALSDPDEAIDRLLLEPVAAARVLQSASDLMDLGSGGGSPAIPLALALRSTRLVMVESKSRKAAFLREAARAAGITAIVEAERFEALSGYDSAFDVVSIRAVRMDREALHTAAGFLRPGGNLALFVTTGATVSTPGGFRVESRTNLIRTTELLRLSKVFHVEHSSTETPGQL